MRTRKGRALRRRYGRGALPPGITVTKVRFVRGGRFHGIGTRVVLEDGYTITFLGPASKSVAIAQARDHRARGDKSEAAP